MLVEVGTEFAISQTADGDARVSLEFLRHAREEFTDFTRSNSQRG